LAVTKDQYILRNFSKIKHKKWELYIVTRVIHLLNDPTIEFVCQQLVKSKTGKRYLTDLCFPTLNLYYEIDEAQHSTEDHQISDAHRKREIIDATSFIERRIKVFDKKGNDRKLPEIDRDIDAFVSFIKKRKKELVAKKEFIPWEYNKKFNPLVHIKRGYLDLKDNVVFLNHRDCMRCFGYTGGHFQRAAWRIKGRQQGLWFPKLYPNKMWNNYLSDDFSEIFMKRADGSDVNIEIKDRNQTVVFAHYKNIFGQVVYKFLGLYQISLKKSNKKQWVFDRLKTRVNLASLWIKKD